MAVDSNVLIYERIREEAHMGRSIISALDAGFKRAFATIVDSNVTMFVAAAILYFLGSGPVRGFAVSLALGILTTIVTAVTMTRMMITLWYRYKRPVQAADLTGSISTMKLLRLAPENTKFPFMRFRRVSYPFSAVMSILSVVLFLTLGMNFGIDFSGGTLIELRAKSGVADLANLRSIAEHLNVGDVEVQGFGTPADVTLRFGVQQTRRATPPRRRRRSRASRPPSMTITTFRRVEVVGPRVSGELVQSGTLGVVHLDHRRAVPICGSASNGSSRSAPSSRRCTIFC